MDAEARKWLDGYEFIARTFKHGINLSERKWGMHAIRNCVHDWPLSTWAAGYADAWTDAFGC